MRTITSRLLLAATLCLPLSAVSAEEAPAQRDLVETADAIRDGEIDVGTRYDMHKKEGRFHRVHSEVIGIECEGCHVAESYAPDYLLVDRRNATLKAEGVGKGSKADVLDRSVCLGCHKPGGVGTVWYQGVNK
jgi:hypothetical protein